MKFIPKILPLVLFVLGFALTTQAQQNENMIGLKKAGFIFPKDVYVKCDIELTQEQLIKLFSKDPNMNKYTTPLLIHYASSKLLSSTASLLIGIPLVQQAADVDEPDWNLAYIGAGCLLAAIPFKLMYKKKARKAVAYYNSGYREKEDLSFKLQPAGNGLSLVVNF